MNRGRLSGLTVGLILLALWTAAPAFGYVKFEAKWGQGQGPCQTGDSQFCVPEGIGASSVHGVAVADTSVAGLAEGHRILRYTPSGSFITKWGSNGDGNGQFLEPADVAFSNSAEVTDRIYVADRNNSR